MPTTRRGSPAAILPGGIALALLLTVACSGSGGPSAPQEPARGRLIIAYFPDPGVGAPAVEAEADYVTRFEMRIREAGGVAVTLARIEVGVNTDPSAQLRLDTPDIIAAAGSNRLEPRGLLVVPVEFFYRGDESATDLLVIIEGADARGNPVELRGGMPIR
jgi:hypothetical protein